LRFVEVFLFTNKGVRILIDLADSDDEEIAEAADEAIGMAETASDEEDDEEVGSEWIN
jgi:hypothetical protein